MIRQTCQTCAHPGRKLSSRSSSASRHALDCIFNLLLRKKGAAARSMFARQLLHSPDRNAIFGGSSFKRAAPSCNRTQLLRLMGAISVKSGTDRSASNASDHEEVLLVVALGCNAGS